ncbi:unnamed protein product [Somion occarium]|uniref:Post-SET domain-containing protein n=1 Tax=Somion occarium TaxID=3059160 RepID=A0ABP1E4K0_9APHY
MSPSYSPTHPELFTVQFGDGEFSAFLQSNKTFEAGEVIAKLEGITIGTPKRYTSVQCGEYSQDNLELNSDLRFANHSCEPSTDWDLSSPNPADWHVRARKRIEAGDSITFFYPCTEWDMIQPFKCSCGAPTCLGTIQGAKYLDVKEVTSRAFINPWIRRLLKEKEALN